jgi:hypothetical protein
MWRSWSAYPLLRLPAVADNAAVERNSNEPPQTSEDPGCTYLFSIMLAAVGVVVFLVGCVILVRAGGAPPVHGIREGVQNFYGAVALIGATMIALGAAMGFALHLKRRKR